MGLGILKDFEGLLYPVGIVINSVYRECEISRLMGVVDVDGSMRVDWQGEGFRRWPLVSAYGGQVAYFTYVYSIGFCRWGKWLIHG